LCCCRAFLGFITRSRNTRQRLDGAKELKKLVYFSNIVVSPLLKDLQVPCYARRRMSPWLRNPLRLAACCDDRDSAPEALRKAPAAMR